MTAAHYLVKYQTNSLPFVRSDHYSIQPSLAQINEWHELLMSLDDGGQTYHGLTSTDSNGETVLHLSALNGKAVAVKVLLDIATFANLNLVEVKNKFGQTALDVASSEN